LEPVVAGLTPPAPIKPSSPAPIAEAQAHYKTKLEQAQHYKEINGVPSPIVITHCKYP
jgi:hypothetical protein